MVRLSLTSMVKFLDAVWAGVSLSVTSTVKLPVIIAVGVPVIVPVAGSMLNPDGRAPFFTTQVWGLIPPLEPMVAM